MLAKVPSDGHISRPSATPISLISAAAIEMQMAPAAVGPDSIDRVLHGACALNVSSIRRCNPSDIQGVSSNAGQNVSLKMINCMKKALIPYYFLPRGEINEKQGFCL